MNKAYFRRGDDSVKYRKAIKKRIDLHSNKITLKEVKPNTAKNRYIVSPFSRAESEKSAFNKTIDSKDSISSMSIEEKQLMIQMQKKLEGIENKLNFFMQEVTNRTSFGASEKHLLSPEENKFLEKAKHEIYAKAEPNTEYRKSFSKSSLQGNEEGSVKSENFIMQSFRKSNVKVKFESENNSNAKHNLRLTTFTNDTNSTCNEASEVSNQHGGRKNFHHFNSIDVNQCLN